MSPSPDVNNQPIITMKEIADRCGVHQSTVQRALTDSDEVSTKTAERIRAIAVELGYNPAYNQAARRLALHRHGKLLVNRVIALFFPHGFARVNYFHRLFQGIIDGVNNRGFDLLMTSNDGDWHTKALPGSVTRGEVDGVLIFTQQGILHIIEQKLRAEIKFAQRPIVSLMVLAPPGCSGVMIDDHSAAYATADHVLSLGHRHLLHLYGVNGSNTIMVQRQEGLQQACAVHSLDPRQHLITAAPESIHNEDSLARELARQLRQHPGITAVLAPNDIAAISCARVLTQAGLRIPEDISLLGFDDTDPLFDAQQQNMLTTIRSPLEQLGCIAADLLIDHITGVARQNTQVVLPTQLIIRGSTAPPKNRGRMETGT